MSLEFHFCKHILLCSFLIISQHFQLLLQTFLLARFEKSLLFLSQIAAQALVGVVIDLYLLISYIILGGNDLMVFRI